MTVADEEDTLANAQHGVHVVGIDDGGHAILVGDAADEVVDDEARLGVEAGVRLVAEEVLGIEGDGSGNGYALLHTAAYLARHLVLRSFQVDALQTETGTIHSVGLIHIGEHVQGEHDVLQNRHRVEERSALEYHAHLAAQHHSLALVHRHEVASVIEHLALGGCKEADDVLYQHRLAGTGLTDNEVGLSVVEGHVDVHEDVTVIETLV